MKSAPLAPSPPPRAAAAPWGWLFVAALAAGGLSGLGHVPPLPLLGLAALGVALLSLLGLYRWRARRRWKALVVACVPLALLVALAGRTYFRYRTADTMSLAVREYRNDEYPEDPAARSACYGKYHGRRLTLLRKGPTTFDFVFAPEHDHIATVAFRDIDVSLMTPGLPAWARDDAGLRRIALTDRQWNRQQVRFDVPSPHVEVTGGDGFERDNLFTAELAKNCLNAGLWEVLLFVNEPGGKALYYQGWFTFPLGHYKELFEHNTGLNYRDHWYYLEHWFDPAGTPVPMDQLRRVVSAREVPTTFDADERPLAEGEQARKRRTTLAENVVRWGDFFDGRRVEFASFIPPGRYSVARPWKNEYRRMDRFERAYLRQVVSPASDQGLHEIELVFSSTARPGQCRFFVTGFELAKLPALPPRRYPEGLYMPMGIGVPPFFQSYDALRRSPPQRSPYVSVLLDESERWIDHHKFALDGPVLHRDDRDPSVLHLYLLSYERHSLIGHFVLRTGG